MKRVMVNLDDATGEKLEAQARKEKRSASGYIGVLIEKDLRAAGLLESPAKAEVIAAAEEIGLEEAALILVRAKRRMKNQPSMRHRRLEPSSAR